MIDALLILLIILAIFVGTKNHNPKITPYFLSLVFGFILAVGLDSLLAQYINNQTQLDYAFSTIFSFGILLLIGSILFYACLLIYHRFDSERATNLYSHFSKGNFITLPLMTVVIFCLIAVFLTEIPTKTTAVETMQSNVSKAKSIGYFRSLVQKAGIEPSLVSKLGKVPLSQKETSEEIIPLAFKSVTINYDQKQELEMTRLINIERFNEGLKPLEYNSELADVARNHSIDMLKRRYFAHINLDGKTPFDRLHESNISYSIAGENLAISNNLEKAVSALMESPAHKANIMNDKFHKTGIGIATNQDGIMAITQEFAN